MAYSYREIMDRRNERDRRLSARKRCRRQEMREEVKKLEEQKKQLEARFAQLDQVDETQTQTQTESEADKLEGNTDTEASVDGSPRARAATRHRYLEAVQRVEMLRKEKTALLAEVSWRELVRNAVQVTVDEANAEQQEDLERRLLTAQVAFEQERPIMSDLQAILLREKLCAQIEAILTRLGTMERLTQIEIFGWSDLRFSGAGSFIDLAVTKRFYHESADALWAKTWKNSTTGHDLRIFCRSFFDREPTFEFHGVNFAATRGPNIAKNLNDDGTGFIVVRTRNMQGGGGGCVLIAELNPNAVATDLATHRPFLRAMYWLFKDVPADATHDGYALAQFGTSIPTASYEVLRVIISELIFSVVRWETLGFRASMLEWGESSDTEDAGRTDQSDPRMYRDPSYRVHANAPDTSMRWQQGQQQDFAEPSGMKFEDLTEDASQADMSGTGSNTQLESSRRPWEAQVSPSLWMQ